MNFIYHMTPENMLGDTLYPLNELKAIYSKVYNKNIKKYKGRELLLEERIPILNCLWNDVLHFTAVHPFNIKTALREAGFNPPEKRWFAINPYDIGSESAVIYGYDQGNTDDWLNRNNFEKYNSNNISEYSTLPESTKKYYKQEFKNRRQPFLFVGIPHILFKGNLNVRGMQIIEA